MAVQPQKLPPTSAAAKFHSKRVCLQVQEWKHLRETLSPTAWGLELKDNTMFPTYTTKAVAPDNLLCIITCNCKADCNTDRCSSRRLCCVWRVQGRVLHELHREHGGREL
ncbi:hypothetical protein BaRGS_00039996 [Batillaria attramentaria]|uniref:Uncharacterized protein n=1 Tax=Batillaria attramentaria TaxID=370345 RepID=A0ABD0J1T6_9CAEN